MFSDRGPPILGRFATTAANVTSDTRGVLGVQGSPQLPPPSVEEGHQRAGQRGEAVQEARSAQDGRETRCACLRLVGAGGRARRRGVQQGESIMHRRRPDEETLQALRGVAHAQSVHFQDVLPLPWSL